MLLQFDNEDKFEEIRQKLKEFDIEYLWRRNEEKYEVMIADGQLTNILTFLSELIILAIDNSLGDKVVSDMVKKLLIIHNKIVLNEEINE